MNNKVKSSIFALALTALLPLGVHAQAPSTWVSASATQVDKDGPDPYVTIDVSSSIEVFVARNGVPLDGLKIIDPEGNPVAAENKLVGKARSTAELKLTKPGTYKIGLETQSVVAAYRLPPGSPNLPPVIAGAPPAKGGVGQVRREMSPDEFKSFKIPEDATQVRITKNLRRYETFVTYDRASAGVLKTTGMGLELIPLTHPNEIALKQKASFRFLLNGKPLGSFSFTLVPEGVRYRGVLKEMNLKTDDQGQFTITLPEGGKYWIAASYPARAMPGPGAAPQAAPDPNAAPVYADAYVYGAELEVLY